MFDFPADVKMILWSLLLIPRPVKSLQRKEEGAGGGFVWGLPSSMFQGGRALCGLVPMVSRRKMFDLFWDIEITLCPFMCGILHSLRLCV